MSTTVGASAQVSKQLEHEDVENWNRISESNISRDGKWILWEEGPEDKDGVLRIKAVSGTREYAVDRGEAATFSGNSRFVAFKIAPMRDSVRAAKLAKKKCDDLPKEDLGIVRLDSEMIDQIEGVLSYELPEDAGSRIAYRLVKTETESDSSKVEKEREEPEEETCGNEREEDDDDEKEEGTRLIVRDLESGAEIEIDDVTEYAFSKDGTSLAYVRSNKAGDVDGLYVLREGESEPVGLLTGAGEYAQVAFDEGSQQIAFLSNREDFAADQPAFTLYRAELGDGVAKAVAGIKSPGLSDGWWVSEHGRVYFSESGSHLYFGTAPRPEPNPKDDDVLDEEKVVLDVWSWTDPHLQPMQLLNVNENRDRTYLAVLRKGSDKVIQLGTESIPDVIVAGQGDGEVALGYSGLAYRQEISWDSPQYYDAWQIDAQTGESGQILEKIQDRPWLSPEGKYVFWWDRTDLVWRAISTESGEPAKISTRIPYSVTDELHDEPSKPGSYGFAGWTNNDSRFLFYDKYDIWAVEVHGDSAPQNVTEGVGRERNLRFRLIDLDPDEPSIDPNAELLLSAFDLETKYSGFFQDRVNGTRLPRQLLMSGHYFRISRKAEEADVLLYTRESFNEFPDIWTANTDLEQSVKMSDANPQQSGFSWGTAELYNWTSLDGQPLEGILYKPDGFDASQKYPMMVYFYERYSDDLHRHHIPAAGSSSINRSFYVSRGYLLFVPDIPYKVGYPGESAMNAVMPGVTALIGEGFVDADHIGVQGHSWGGYQIAYMVTQTNLFAAAEAGAPVSNMTSAYGGIRWSSGMSRMFQYERTQSRIGGTLWNATQRYIHNSPLFQADKVETPVLMMHNDQDGAVPWYQGIEFFVALRRLGKPAWLLNYNNEAHGLRQYKNRKDWTIRLQQFFDYYLKEAPPPKWLKDGIPAVDKGRTLGLELLTEKDRM